MNEVDTPVFKGELLSIIKPLIIKILEEEFLTKNSNSTLINNHANGNGIVNDPSVPVNKLSSTEANRSKELELIERIIHLEAQGNYIREDINKSNANIDKRFLEVKQDSDKQFLAVRQEMKELRQDMDKRFDKQTNLIISIFGMGFTFITILITVFKFIK